MHSSYDYYWNYTYEFDAYNLKPHEAQRILDSGTGCPDGISNARWRAICKQLNSRKQEEKPMQVGCIHCGQFAIIYHKESKCTHCDKKLMEK